MKQDATEVRPTFVVIACPGCVGVRTCKRLNEVDIKPSGTTDYTCDQCGDQCVVEAYETEYRR